MARLTLSLLAACTMLGACSNIPKEAFYNHGTPESLLDLSVETVNVNLSSQSSIDELVDWVNRDQPSRAELHCASGGMLCSQAMNVFSQFSIPAERVDSGETKAVLVYERVMARDCENSFMDNTINPYNMNHPTFGCSIAANMVQMVGDKRQFVSPNLLDFHDGEKLATGYRNYQSGAAGKTTTFGTLLESTTGSGSK